MDMDRKAPAKGQKAAGKKATTQSDRNGHKKPGVGARKPKRLLGPKRERETRPAQNHRSVGNRQKSKRGPQAWTETQERITGGRGGRTNCIHGKRS